jgi:hypothetical protein
MNSGLDGIQVRVRAFGAVRQALGASELDLDLPAGAAALGPSAKGDAGRVSQRSGKDLALGCHSSSVYSSTGLPRYPPCRPSLARPSVSASWRMISLRRTGEVLYTRLGERRPSEM